jgi:glycosyltransferase involved in cell wall biosynthesis
MKKKLNLVFLSNANGGIATFQSNLINFLHEKKIKTYLLDKINNQTFFSINKKKNIKTFYSNVLKEIKLTIKYLSEIKNSNTLNIFIISNPVILLIYFFPIKLMFRKNRIIFFHHSHIIKNALYDYFIGYLTTLFKIFIDKTVYVSKFTKEWWEKFFFANRFLKSKIIFNSTEKIKIKIKNRNKINVGFIGRFDSEKGIDKFLMYTKKSNLKNLNFIIFGDGNLKSLIPKKNKNIKLYNWSSKNFIYSQIDILFVTSEIENCPFTVIEAKSVGIPTITTSNGGINEIIKNNHDGIILKKNSKIIEINNSILEIINKYQIYRKNCLINSKKFSKKNQAKILKLFL